MLSCSLAVLTMSGDGSQTSPPVLIPDATDSDFVVHLQGRDLTSTAFLLENCQFQFLAVILRSNLHLLKCLNGEGLRNIKLQHEATSEYLLILVCLRSKGSALGM